MRRWALTLPLVFGLALPAQAGEARPVVADPVLEARVMAIASELRCLVCQNQTIADSQAALAVDLRDQVREMLRRGEDQPRIIDFMTARYGDFVLYRPPVRAGTWLLWFGPVLLLVFSVLALLLHLRRRALQPDALFDAEAPELVSPDNPITETLV